VIEQRIVDESLVSPVSFATILRKSRERCGLSQSRLAARAGFDHSYVSRLESGSRTPTRVAVLKLSEAMSLEETHRDELLASAGYMPMSIENLVAAEPIVGEVLGLLKDRAIPEDVREDLRTAVEMAVRQAQRAAPSWPADSNADQVAASDVAAD
jgi:transcriptional regulator with XRE-family HTH domain